MFENVVNPLIHLALQIHVQARLGCVATGILDKNERTEDDGEGRQEEAEEEEEQEEQEEEQEEQQQEEELTKCALSGTTPFSQYGPRSCPAPLWS